MRFFRMAVLSLAVGNALSTSALASSDDGYVRQGRYALQKIQTVSASATPLQSVIQIRLSASIKSVGDAIDELLRGSGYRFNSGTSRREVTIALRQFTDGQLPDVQRSIGPMRLIDALSVIAGPTWEVKVDELRRQVRLSLKNPALIPSPPQVRKPVAQVPLQRIEQYVPFADGKSKPGPKARSVLNAIAKRYSETPANIAITGYSHNPKGPGSTSLAMDRARSVEAYLRDHGVAGQLVTKSSVKSHSAAKKTGVSIAIAERSTPVLLAAASTAPPLVKVKLSQGTVSTQFNLAMKALGFERGIWHADEQWIKTPTQFTARTRKEAVTHLASALRICVIESSRNAVIEARNAGDCDE